MTVNETEEKTLNIEIETEPEAEIETEVEEAIEEVEEETEAEVEGEVDTEIVTESEEKTEVEAPPALNDDQIRAAALAYARFLSDNNLTPGEEFLSEPEEGDEEEVSPAEETVEETVHEPELTEEEKAERKKKAEEENKGEARRQAALMKLRKREEAKSRNKEKFLRQGKTPLAGVTNLHDKIQDGIDSTFSNIGMDVVRGVHRISSTYKNSRRTIGIAILVTGLLAAGILVVFDLNTVYEYAYNGKVLGYVRNQEEVTDVLDIAGRQLTYNSSTVADVKFVANQNVTFNPVDGRGKSTDDSDTVVNKLIYMTDIETEAYAVYDGDKAVAIVKDQNDADALLLQTKADLSTPDRGMELVSAEFTNNLSIKPVNVLLGSVQSNVAAQTQMSSGGEMNVYHIAEEDKT